MNIKINGKNEEIKKTVSISGLIASKGLPADRIVVEHNFKIIAKEEWPKILLSEDDNLEIVSFMGGG